MFNRKRTSKDLWLETKVKKANEIANRKEYNYGDTLTIEELEKDIKTRIHLLKKRNPEVSEYNSKEYNTYKLILAVISHPDNALTRTMPRWVEEMEETNATNN